MRTAPFSPWAPLAPRLDHGEVRLRARSVGAFRVVISATLTLHRAGLVQYVRVTRRERCDGAVVGRSVAQHRERSPGRCGTGNGLTVLRHVGVGADLVRVAGGG